MKAEVVCTTDDPIDDLRYHKQMAASTDSGVKMLPAFRADKAMAVENVANFRKYLDALSAAADVSIARFVDLLTALRKRHDYFHQNGCRLSDHGLETAYAEDYAHAEIEASFGRLLTGQTLGTDETRKFKSAVLFELAVMDSEKGWVQQFHLGALRNNNLRMMRTIGPDTGYDSIGDFEIAKPLAKLLGRLDDAGKLAKTILYNLNPRDNELMATMIANFQDGSTPGKLQYGAAWWFLDQKDGMTQQIEALSNMGLLSQFIGMLTDSRSFLSFPRHEYFRRILCNILGDEMERGLIPKDTRLVGEMVANICYGNAKRYFNFDEALRNN
jgi:glucuronate isomerase